MITLKPIEEIHDKYGILYRLLIERPIEANISHANIPTLENHIKYVDKHPHLAWFFILNEELHIVGSIYLSTRDEIGVAILKEWQRHGYATEAITALINKFPRKAFYANINPTNTHSIELFTKMKFELVQHTYRFTA